ncbi:MAG TPA: IS1182 family transposase, partial [Candidatus Cloacimonetes bacterium]|nr:IS1182 family transposase [Candidatus Cloacimonadota bacterium]
QRDGSKFRPYDQVQTKFVNLNYKEILGEDSDAVMINDIIEAMDLSSIESEYVEVGNIAYNPKEMMKILVYGYFKGYFGGRPLYKNYKNDLGLRYLSNDDFPDFRTINVFRVKFKDEIADVFAQVVMLCKELGMLGFENLSVDGQKIKANANVFQNKNLKSIRKEKEKIEKLLKKLLSNEIEFKNVDDKQKKKKKLERRKNRLEHATQLLIDAGAENDDKLRYNLTDPEAKIMQDKRGVKNPDYNAQNAVDDKFQVLTAVNVIDAQSDSGQLDPMKEESEMNTGSPHEHTLADCGYPDKETFVQMEMDPTTEYYVPDKTKHSSRNNPYSKWNFIYHKDLDVYFCPQGVKLSFVRICKDKDGFEYRLYQAEDCSGCPVKDKCRRKSKNKDKKINNRTISVYPQDEAVKRMRKKLDSEDGKKIYQRRMSTVEPLHGDMQKNRGFTQFVLRGLEKVNIEYNLLAIAHNIRKIILHGANALKKLLGKAQIIA